MKKYLLGLGLVLSIGLMSCGKDVIFDEDAQLETDILLIEDFIAGKGLEADTVLPSEIRMIIQDPGTPEKIKFGDSVWADYTGYLLDESEFDSSEGRDPISFVMGAGNVVRGWEIAFKELGRGGKATIFIPSYLGYGNSRQGTIPANSVLIFEVTVTEVR